MNNKITPVGYQLLLKPFTGPEKVGSILLAPKTQDENRIMSVVCEVVAMGPDAFGDEDKFVEPYCVVGDWVLVTRHSGARFKYDGEEYRLVNDDLIVAKVDDPTKVEWI